MRRAFTALGVLLTTAIATPAVAGPLADPAPWVLPVNAFAKAQAGDWTILEGEALLGGTRVQEREIIRVGNVVRGVAEVQLFEGAAEREAWFLSFPVDVKRGPDTNLLYDLPWIASDLAQAPATCTLGTASVPCTKVTYRTPSHRVTVMMAAQVKGSGIVSFEIVRDGEAAPVWSMKTIGYGTGGKVAWGAGPPRKDLDASWDGGAQPTAMREGTVPAAPDVWAEEPPPLAMPPRADLPSCTVVGDRARGDVQRLLLRKLIAIEDCYARAVTAKKVGGGSVNVTFAIDELAAVTELMTTGSAAAPVRACVHDAVLPVQFPFSDGGGVTSVTCTFTFDPGKPAPRPKKPAKRTLVSKRHPARGGPDLRGVPRIP